MTVPIVRPQRSKICGYCASGSHDRCAVGTKNARGHIHPCLCDQGGCTRGRRKCTYCGNRKTDEVNPETWECFDVDGCRVYVEARREANPLSRELREAQESARMAKIEDNKDKAAKAEKVREKTYCLVTGEETKGGLFKPGMDARYVSNHVEAVTSGAQTEKQARDKMAKDKVSDKLVAKFDKQLGLARERAEKKAAAAKEKADAKAASDKAPATSAS